MGAPYTNKTHPPSVFLNGGLKPTDEQLLDAVLLDHVIVDKQRWAAELAVDFHLFVEFDPAAGAVRQALDPRLAPVDMRSVLQIRCVG
jgi:hypothetical protein